MIEHLPGVLPGWQKVKPNLLRLSMTMAWEQWQLTGHGPVNALWLLSLTILYL